MYQITKLSKTKQEALPLEKKTHQNGHCFSSKPLIKFKLKINEQDMIFCVIRRIICKGLIIPLFPMLSVTDNK